MQTYAAALRAVNGRSRVREYLQSHVLSGPVTLLAVGKAATAMTQGAIDVLGERIRAAWIVTKHGYAEPLPWPVRTAGHPLPDADSLAAGQALREFIQGLPGDAQILCLLSGGASALVESLPAGVGLAQLQVLNRWLLASGLDIAACNRLRQRLSLLKGGRLAALLAPRPVLCLCLSDVPGDDPAVIGSGPLVPAPDAGEQLPAGLPPDVAAAMAHTPPAPVPEAPCVDSVELRVIANLQRAKEAAAAAAAALGYGASVHDEFLRGDAVVAGGRLAEALLRADTDTVHIWGGETTVVLPPSAGRGGRCQSLALAAAARLRGHASCFVLAAGTDGSDGPGADAGALVDGDTLARGEGAGFDAQKTLTAADAGSFLAASGDLLQTGPTGTNVMDLVLGLKGKRS